MKLKDLRIGVKQTIGFVCILLLMAGANFSSFYQLFTVKESIDAITSSWFPRAVAIAEININTTDLRQNQLQLIFSNSQSEREVQSERIVRLIDSIVVNLDSYDRLREGAKAQGLYSPEEERLYEAFDAKWDKYQELSFEFFRLTREDDIVEAVDLLNGEARVVFDDFRKDLQQLVHLNSRDSKQAAARADQAFHTARKVAGTIFFASLIVSALAVILTIRMITNPVKRLSEAAGRVEKGDLTVQLFHESEDELGRLTESFNRMTAALAASRTKTQEQESALRAQNLELQETLVRLQEAQQQLIMQEKMASLGNLVAGVAHEINNPIGAVNASADNTRRAALKLLNLLKTDERFSAIVAEPQIEQLLSMLDQNSVITTTASKRIAYIVKSLKTFARLDEAEHQNANIEDGLDTTLTLVHHEYKNRIEVNRDYGKVPEIPCFPNELNQVFMNLLVNASQAIPDKGEVRIKTWSDENWVYVSISDTGMGIPETNIPRIFDPGYTTKGVGVGTGLGLSISYNIIKKHRGEISVSSKVGQGTEFRIKLPRYEKKTTP